MKIEKNILVAFLLNILFSIIEVIGGLLTNSVAIISDSIHDLGDAMCIGISYFMERKSKKRADNNYTYGYIRYSVLGGVISTTVLIVGSILVIIGAINRLFNPVDINYRGMIIFAIIGIILNYTAALVTKKGDSINQKSVNLHMLEDVLGWIVVLIGAIVMNMTDIKILDSFMSIGVAIFILVHSFKNLKKAIDVLMEKTPDDIDLKEIKESLLKIKGVDDIHHVHVWSIDGYHNYATMHVVSKLTNVVKLKSDIRKKLEEKNICHVILEIENKECSDKECH